MASVDMCEHGWPGSGCRECFPESAPIRKVGAIRLKRAREKRRTVLKTGLLACYEIIDSIHKQLAELDALDAGGKTGKESKS